MSEPNLGGKKRNKKTQYNPNCFAEEESSIQPFSVFGSPRDRVAERSFYPQILQRCGLKSRSNTTSEVNQLSLLAADNMLLVIRKQTHTSDICLFVYCYLLLKL